ncbi:DUF63 family protein [Haloferax sp. DFSO52]|uniref:DUF63 family protein n=1 Tax=Haloferax sp. DFSO52 TaxID=3388505 RepID=UPI003A87E9C1
MAILPEGFALPPLPYLVVLVVGLAGIAVGVARSRPTVTDEHVLALVPWMVSGSAFHVLYVVGLLPPVVEPFGGTPAVYLTVAVLAGATFLGLDAAGSASPRNIALPGIVFAGGLVVVGLASGLSAGTLSPLWPGIALVVAVLLTPATWAVLTRIDPMATAAGTLGLLAIFGHALDGVSTAVGIDVLGFSERTPLSRFILDAAGALPTAELVGVGWLFVLVKLAVVGLVVGLLAEYVEEEPTEGALLLGLVAAVGLGPGVHNLLLFTIAGV